MGLEVLGSSGSNLDNLLAVRALQRTRTGEQLSLLFTVSVVSGVRLVFLLRFVFPYSRSLVPCLVLTIALAFAELKESRRAPDKH
jgi:hypothetical protein